ncbi:MAG: YihY/virulence factor BrkB family protein [Actinomycetota bacterium]
MKASPIGTLKEAAGEFKRDRATLAGAGLAFYWFLAIFPALIAGVGILDLLALGAARVEIRRLINLTLPPSAADQLTGILGTAADQPRASIMAVAFGLMVALWGASTGLAALQEGFDVAYDISKIRSFAHKRMRAFKLLGATGLLGGLGIFVLAFGGPLGTAIQRNLVNGWGGFMVLWNVLRFGIAAAALVALVVVLYRFAPNRKPPPLKWLAPGSLIAVTIVALVSAAFSLYVRNFGSYATTYGSLAGVVVLVLWLYLTALALMFGAELNGLLERKSRGDR